MIIGWRRLSGAIGISPEDKGTRGLWWEKRLAMVKLLRSRGHEIVWLSKMTKPSALLSPETRTHEDCDMLIVEFGGTNEVFYGREIQETLGTCDAFAGPKVFLSDDPDLGMPWGRLKSLENWTAWYNCLLPKAFPKHHPRVPALDFPFSATQEVTQDFNELPENSTHLVYIGRPNGREKVFRGLIANGVRFKVFGRANEWEDFGVRVHEAPNQPDRAAFYRQQVAALAIADAKHKKIGFRTGRAYHALLAGCPVVAEADHPALAWAEKFQAPQDLPAIMNQFGDQWLRRAIWAAQVTAVAEQDGPRVARALKETGL